VDLGIAIFLAGCGFGFLAWQVIIYLGNHEE
jgi:hypothetical protein